MPAPSRFLPRAALAALLLLLVPCAWPAPKYKVMHSFTGGNDGGYLWGSLTLGKSGSIYGTARGGGDHNGGVLFELSKSGRNWSETVLYNFCSASGCADGGASVAGVTFDSSGNLYGTTQDGGPLGYGAVFEASPLGDGNWTETVLHGFHSGDFGGCCPYSGVTLDDAGNVFGTPDAGVYELSQGSEGWSYDVLHQFTGENGDGYLSGAGVIRDSNGNLYGTTQMGGGYDNNCGGGCGTVYRLHPKGNGIWQETILHEFGAPGDGTTPDNGALIMDGQGNLYGATASGAIYKLAPRPHGAWKETVLYDIPGGDQGQEPAGGVVMDKAGALYGTTIAGGSAGCGVVYKLAPEAKGKWKYTVLHTLLGFDGCQSAASLVLDSKGNLFGTTTLGGKYDLGVAFELTP
jgi:uncharacterized repeat protein (TIGR03803 family)